MQPSAMAPETVPYVVLERCDRTRNMARYYVLSLEPSLFGDIALVRQWGRLGQAGRQRSDLFRQRAHACLRTAALIGVTARHRPTQ